MSDEIDLEYCTAVGLMFTTRRASTSFLQRTLGISYNKAIRHIERMEQEGVVGKQNFVGKREVLI